MLGHAGVPVDETGRGARRSPNVGSTRGAADSRMPGFAVGRHACRRVGCILSNTGSENRRTLSRAGRTMRRSNLHGRHENADSPRNRAESTPFN